MLYDNDNGEDDNGKDDNLDEDLDADAPPVLEPFFLGGCGEVAAGKKIRFHFIHNLT